MLCESFDRELRVTPKWIEWAGKMQAISQAGLTYSENPYDLDRYRQLRDLAAEIIAEHTDHDHAYVRGFLEAEVGYATPKIDVRGVVLKDKRVLLVRETVDGKWSLPGGWAELFLTPSENVVKEIREESGYTAEAVRLLALYDADRHDLDRSPSSFSSYKLFFLCKLTGGEPTTSIETSGAEFFAPEKLPPLSTRRVTEKQILRMIELAKSGETDFD